jgi:hypothetical protein
MENGVSTDHIRSANHNAEFADETKDKAFL